MSWSLCRRAGGLLVLTLLVTAIATTASATPITTQSIGVGNLVGTYGLERSLIGGTSPPEQFYPSIHGNYIAYEHGTASGMNDVRLFDIARDTAVTISDGTTSADWRPRIWGNRVVWQGYIGNQWEIMWYDIKAGQVHRLTSLPSTQWWPEISGDRVVWEDNRNGNSDVYMYDFKTSQTKRITTSAFDQRLPRISGNRIIYQDNRNGNWDIYWYDLATNTEHRLTTSALNEVTPDVWGTRAAYVRDNAGDLDVFFVRYFDANGFTQTLMGAGAGTIQDRPRVVGNTMVFQNNASGNYAISYYVDGHNGYNHATTSATGEFEPQLWGNTLVYHDDRNGNFDLFATEIVRPSLSLSAPSAAGFGKTTAVSGYLKRMNGTPLAGRTVRVQYVPAAQILTKVPWYEIAATTNGDGKYSATLPIQPARFYVRAVYEGDNDAWFGGSAEKTVLPKVSLTKPAGRSSISNTKSYTYYGYLKPKYTAGSQRVWVKCYRKSGGKWRYKKTYTTTLADYSAESTKYSKKIKLTTEGKWRIRAQFKTTYNHAETYSDYKYISVY